MMMYPIAYIVIWFLPTAIRIYQTITSQPAPFALQTVDKVSLITNQRTSSPVFSPNLSV